MFKLTSKIILIFFIFTNLYAYDVNYNILIQNTKQSQIKKAIELKQYLYDLNKLNEILKLLNQNKSFKFATHTIEGNYIDDFKDKYTSYFIEVLLKILNGVNPEDDSTIGYYNSSLDIGDGYIKYIKDKYEDYEIYLNNYPIKQVLNYNFDYILKNIKQDLKILKIKLNNEDNIKPILKKIMKNLLFALNDIKSETKELKKQHLIKPFGKYINKKYALPSKWTQTDSKTTLYEILNFILNGDNKHLGLNDYYNKIYKNDLAPFSIIQ